MKRSRAFILSEQLMTIMLQASFILVLCASFYQLISFYTRTQQVLTARNHAERVISFMDDKIRNAGLGLWRCKSSSAIRGKLEMIDMLCTTGADQKGYQLPVALKWNEKRTEPKPDGENTAGIPSKSLKQDSGDVLTVLYAVRNPSTRDEEAITAFKTAETLTKRSNDCTLPLLDNSTKNVGNVASLFASTFKPANIKDYAVMESLGVPFLINPTTSNVVVRVYGLDSSETISVPAAGDLMTINCMQMFVHGTTGAGEGRQFAFRELVTDGTDDTGKKWGDTFNQEKGILDIYMEVDRDKNIFTLWVLATGGYDASLNNPRPDSWPKEAYPQGNTDEAAKTAWLDASKSDYSHHIVYVSRASWKLNNIPQGFTWD